MKALSIEGTTTVITKAEIETTYDTLRRIQTFLRETKPERVNALAAGSKAFRENTSAIYAHESMYDMVTGAIKIVNMIQFHPDMKES